MQVGKQRGTERKSQCWRPRCGRERMGAKQSLSAERGRAMDIACVLIVDWHLTWCGTMFRPQPCFQFHSENTAHGPRKVGKNYFWENKFDFTTPEVHLSQLTTPALFSERAALLQTKAAGTNVYRYR